MEPVQATTNSIQWEPTYKTPYNAAKWPKDHEKNYAPSMTIPDQTMTIKEIMDRSAKGLPLSGSKDVPMYEDEETGILWPTDWNKMDLSERQDWMEEKAREIQEIRSKHNKEREKRYYESQEAFYRKKFEEENQKSATSSETTNNEN